MQNYYKFVARKFLVRKTGRLHRLDHKYRSVLINVNRFKFVYIELRVYLLTLMVDNTHTKRGTQLLENFNTNAIIS